MKKALSLVLSIICFLVLLLPVLASELISIKNVVVDDAGRFIMIETANNKALPRPNVARLVQPNRLIIDIPGTSLAIKPKAFIINNSDITQIKVSQVSKSLRIVVESQENKIIEKIKIVPGQTSNLIQLKTIPGTAGFGPNENNEQIRITRIDYRDNQLIIGAIGNIKIKDPIILKDPNRLVVDIPNAKIDDKKLLTPIIVGDNQVNIVRIGQFDNSTVRLVIETDIPNRFQSVFGNNQQTLFITANPVFSVNTLPKNYSLGYIKDIRVTKNKNIGTTVKIEATTPISYRIKRIHNPEKAIIDIINASPPSDNIINNINSTNEVLSVKIGQLMAGNSNSRVVLDVANPSIEMSSSVSESGKIIEINFTEATVPIAFTKAKSEIKVVIDAGHGGYDPGCMTEGYKEKDITLDIAKRVRVLLEKAGITVYMTRSGDDTLSLKERTDFTNTMNVDAFVSIHVNSSTSSGPEGIDTHWYTNQSIPLARKIQSCIINRVPAIDRGIKKNMFYVIHHTEVPAVLVEIGFISNPSERCQLISVNRKQNTAQGIADGVLQFLGMKNSVE